LALEVVQAKSALAVPLLQKILRAFSSLSGEFKSSLNEEVQKIFPFDALACSADKKMSTQV